MPRIAQVMLACWVALACCSSPDTVPKESGVRSLPSQGAKSECASSDGGSTPECASTDVDRRGMRDPRLPDDDLIERLPAIIREQQDASASWDEERYMRQLAEVRHAYERRQFNTAFLAGLDVGKPRFVLRGEVWVFRRDELNRLFALSAYRRELQPEFLAESRRHTVDPYGMSRSVTEYAVHSFCYAIAAAPDAVEHALRVHPLPPTLKPAFEMAQRFCAMPGGFRSRFPDEYWWVNRPKFTLSEAYARMQAAYDRADFSTVLRLRDELLPGPVIKVERRRRWFYRRSGFNTLAAVAAFRQARQIIVDDHPGAAEKASILFCLAIRAAPDVLAIAGDDFPLSQRASALFNEVSLFSCDTSGDLLPTFLDP